MSEITSTSVELRTSSRYAAFNVFSDENAHAYFPNQTQTDRYGQMCFDFGDVDLNTLEISEIDFNFYNELPYAGMKTLQIYAISGNDDGRVISEATDLSEVMGVQLASVTLSEPQSAERYNYGFAFTGTSWGGALAKTVAYLNRLSNPSHVNFILICFDTMAGIRITDATMTIKYTPKKVASVPTFEQNGAIITNAVKGSAVRIRTNRATTDLTHTLYYMVNGVQTTIATGVGAVYDWTIPTTLGESVTVYCQTLDGTTQVGQVQSATLVLTEAPGSRAPTINSITIADTTPGIVTRFGAHVRGRSALVVTTSATAAAGTTITGYRVTVDGSTYAGQSVVTGTLITSGTSIPVVVSVTGSTGDVTTETRYINVLDYSIPTIAGFTAVRCDENGSQDPAGESVLITATGEIASMSGDNTASAVLRFRQSGGDEDDWSEGVELTMQDYDLVITDEVVDLGLDPSVGSYDFRLELTDYFATVAQQTGTETKHHIYRCVKNQYLEMLVPFRTAPGHPLGVQYGGTGETSLEPLIQEILSRIPTPSIDAGSSYVVLGSVCIVWGTATIYSFSTNGSATINFSTALPTGKTFAAAPIVHATPKWTMTSTYGSIVSTYVQSVTAAQAVVCMEASRAMGIQGSEYFNWLAIGTLNT